MSFDQRFFYFVNRDLASGFLDAVMPLAEYLGDKKFLFIGLCVLWVFAKRARRVATLSLISLAAAAGSVGVLKGIFAMPRPIAVLPDVRLLTATGLGNSFPSGHATFAFAVLFVFAAEYPKFKYPLLLLAALAALSRVYTGAHFPSDVLAGTVLGSVLSLAVVSIARRLSKKPAI